MKVRLCVLGPVVVFLCSIPQTGYGGDSKPSADQRSQQMASSSRRNPWTRTSAETRLESDEHRRPQNTLGDSKRQPVDKYVVNLRSQRNNATKDYSLGRSKSKLASSSDSRKELAHKSSSNSTSFTLTKNRSQLKPSSRIISKVDEKVSKAEDGFRTEANRNLTKTVDLDRKELSKAKRGWVRNQFYVLEEHMGPEPQSVPATLSTNKTRKKMTRLRGDPKPLRKGVWEESVLHNVCPLKRESEGTESDRPVPEADGHSARL
ncbi:hypothetical protein WMY93_000493 [Mugilogobius chulae]|uniref:Uncharacterized protein n=1 Tax=Mugilogobius chulae TaxID=88201 RepID=A0AAW0Q9J7_9GOBI